MSCHEEGSGKMKPTKISDQKIKKGHKQLCLIMEEYVLTCQVQNIPS